MRRGAGGRRRAPRRARHHQSARDGGALGSPDARAGGAGDRVAGPPDHRPLPRAPGERGGGDVAGADRARGRPLFLRHQARMAAARSRGFAAVPAEASWRPARSRAGWWPGSPAVARTSATTPTPRARCSTTSDRADWDPELLELFGVPAECLPASWARPSWWARPMPRTSDTRCPSPGSPATSRPRSSGRGAAEPGWPRTPTAPGPSSWCCRGPQVPAPRAWRTRPPPHAAPPGEPAYALEGSVFIAGAAVQWLRDGLGLIRDAAETEALARSVPDTRRRVLRAGVRRPGHAVLGARGPGDDHRPHPGHHPGPPRPSSARGDRLQQRRAAGGNGRGGATRRPDASGRRRRRGQRSG